MGPMASESKTHNGCHLDCVDLKNGNPVRLPADNQSNPIEKEEEHYVKRNQMALHWGDGDGVFDCGRYGWFATELTMYYPVAVGGPLTTVVDGIVDDFMKENPDITVKAIYAGNYNDARIKALAALKSGQPAQLSVMFSIDIYEMIEQDAIVAFDDVVETAEEKAWLDSFYPALMENGRTRERPGAFLFSAAPSSCTITKTLFVPRGWTPKCRRQPGMNWSPWVKN